jgi:5-methylcytosine-specific restriction endonuclease McrA
MNSYDFYSQTRDPIALLRKKFVTICDNNHCAAMQLDAISATYATYLEAIEWADDPDAYKPAARRTIAELAANMFELFEIEAVENALAFLAQKGYVTAEYATDDTYTPHRYRTMRILYQKENVELAYAAYDVPTHQTTQGIRSQVTGKTQQAQQITPEEEGKRERERILEGERRKVKYHNTRASRANLPATLTLEQWLETLDHYNWRCAYCQGAYSVLEHFIPLGHGEGTVWGNCVPACYKCNTLKQAWNPLSNWGTNLDMIREGIDQAKIYLQKRGRETAC